MKATRLRLPARLRPRWRDLPGLAALAQRRLGPPAVHPLTRPAACWLWLSALAVMHAGGRLLGHRDACVSVTGPRTSWSRRAAVAATAAAAAAVNAAWISLPFTLAAHTAGPAWASPAAWTLAGAAVLGLLYELGSLLLRGRAAIPVATTVRHLRRHADGIWWEAGNLVAREDCGLVAGRLVHHALQLADAHQAGLVAAPTGPATHRAYLRCGFTRGPLDARVLIRPPQPSGLPAPAAGH